ncbi:MAG TPA: Panacea domain-containing protein [Candidatus Saccharimonadales bacterium]
MTNLSKTQALLEFFAHSHDKPSVTVLMKLCYLTDLIAIKRLRRPITEYEYERYTFGPFNKRIYQDLEHLVGVSRLEVEIDYPTFGTDSEVVLYRHTQDLANVEQKLDIEEIEVASEVLKTLSGYGARQLTEVAYQTKPMVALGATLGGNQNLGVKLDLKAS